MNDSSSPSASTTTTVPAITVDVHCSVCGYNLRGLPRDGRCGECGASVAHSLRVGLSRSGNESWLRAVAGGSVLGSLLAPWAWVPLFWPAMWWAAWQMVSPDVTRPGGVAPLRTLALRALVVGAPVLFVLGAGPALIGYWSSHRAALTFPLMHGVYVCMAVGGVLTAMGVVLAAAVAAARGQIRYRGAVVSAGLLCIALGLLVYALWILVGIRNLDYAAIAEAIAAVLSIPALGIAMSSLGGMWRVFDVSRASIAATYSDRVCWTRPEPGRPRSHAAPTATASAS